MRAAFVVIAGVKRGQRIELCDEDEMSIGRGLEADHRLDDPFMSRVQLRLSVSGTRVTVRDAGSKTGTRINGELIEQYQLHQLQPGDVIQAGSTSLRLQPSGTSEPVEIRDEADDSVAHCFAQLPCADEEAYEHLWNAFFPRLVAWARSHLHSGHRRAADEEDIALDAMDIFFRGLEDGRFKLDDRDECWRLLIAIATRRVIDLQRREMAEKRGGGEIRGDSALGDAGSIAGIEQVLDRRSPFGVNGQLTIVAEELMHQLGSEVLRQTADLKRQGFSNREISQRMHCSLSTTKHRLKEIRRRWS